MENNFFNANTLSYNESWMISNILSYNSISPMRFFLLKFYDITQSSHVKQVSLGKCNLVSQKLFNDFYRIYNRYPKSSNITYNYKYQNHNLNSVKSLKLKKFYESNMAEFLFKDLKWPNVFYSTRYGELLVDDNMPAQTNLANLDLGCNNELDRFKVKDFTTDDYGYTTLKGLLYNIASRNKSFLGFNQINVLKSVLNYKNLSEQFDTRLVNNNFLIKRETLFYNTFFGYSTSNRTISNFKTLSFTKNFMNSKKFYE